MAEFNVYTGDGNFGTSFDHEIEADDLDGAVAIFMAGVKPEHRELFGEPEGEENEALLMALEGPEGESAGNGAAFYCAEIYPTEHDPRGGGR
jgi:hypothetical protein